jgi:hypothetical protein
MFVAIFPIALTVEQPSWALALYGFVLFWAVVIALLAHRWYRVTVRTEHDRRRPRSRAPRPARTGRPPTTTAASGPK